MPSCIPGGFIEHKDVTIGLNNYRYDYNCVLPQ